MANTVLGFKVQQKFPVLTISKTNPVQVEITGHGMSNNQWVRATNFFVVPSANNTGMHELKNRLFQIRNITDNTFDLYDGEGVPVDGTGYTTYVTNSLTQFTLTGESLNTRNLNTQ